MSSGDWKKHKYIDRIEKDGRKHYIYRGTIEDFVDKKHARRKQTPQPTLIDWSKPETQNIADIPNKVMKAGADWIKQYILGQKNEIKFEWD